MSARLSFTHDMEELHEDLIEMGALAEQAIGNALNAIRTQDVTLARQIIEGDDKVDAMEKRIEQRCLAILARHQPLAGDLRMVGAALKIITDLERISDSATDIAELVTQLAGQQYIKPLVDIPRMAETAIQMVHDAIDAFTRREMQLARDVCLRDDEVDNAFSRVMFDLIRLMRSMPEAASQAVDLLLVAKYLERIADHATNIAEWAIYLVNGQHPQDKDIHHMVEHTEGN